MLGREMAAIEMDAQANAGFIRSAWARTVDCVLTTDLLS
jgi:hypothetical protein